MISRYTIENIFALRDLNNFCRVTYDSTKKYGFVVHMDKKQVRFQCHEKGLYIYKTNNRYLESLKKYNLRNIGVEKSISQIQTNSGIQLNTFKKKIEDFTKKQVKRNKRQGESIISWEI